MKLKNRWNTPERVPRGNSSEFIVDLEFHRFIVCWAGAMALPLQFTLSLSLSLIKMSNVPKQTEEDSKAHLCVFVCECSSISMMVSVCKILICPSRVQPYLFLFPEIQFIVALARIAYGSLHRIFSNFIWRWHFDRCHGIRIPPSIAT